MRQEPMGSQHEMDRLEAGQKIRDSQNNSTGVVLEYACQYAHPKADPVYSYLIRWQDGQVQAVTETAFDGSLGLQIID
jgi:hypothetical protein